MGKKKKSSKKTKDEAADGGDEATPAADGEFDPTALKKKKKKKPAKAAEADDFEAKLAEAGVNENGEVDANAKAATQEGQAEEIEGDMVAGTGIWAHNEEKPIKYDKLLERFFAHLHSAHPDLLSSGSKSYVIPPPQCLREGNKKTIFANIPDICKRMKRSEEHVMQFIFAELGTSGSVDGSRRLVIKGRFQQKQIENVLRRYIGKPCTLLFMHSVSVLTSLKANMLPARPAGHQTRNSARGRTVCTSSPATLAAVDVRSRLSRLVTRLKLGRERGSRHEQSSLSPYQIGIMAYSLGLLRCAWSRHGIVLALQEIRQNHIFLVLCAGLAKAMLPV